MSIEDTRALRADPGALAAVAEYRAARERGEWRRLVLPDADLRDSDLSGLDLDECDLAGAMLDGARMVGSSLVRSNLAGTSLLGADLSYASLDRADLEAADATAAAFTSATLRRASMLGCRLHRADLTGADLTRANLYEANLTAANLSGALADEANLHGATLEDAVLTGVRGKPQFDDLSDRSSSLTAALWASARIGGGQLAELAGLYLSTMGWGVIEQAGWRDEGIDLMAKRDDVLAIVQVKATVTPSDESFTHLAQRLKRATQGHPDALLILVMPGPVPDSIQDLARSNRISVLSVRIDEKTMRVDEVVGPGIDQLAASA